jgi:hypothetical protein
MKLRSYEFVICGKSRRVEMSYNWKITVDYPTGFSTSSFGGVVCQGKCGMLCDPINLAVQRIQHRACVSGVVPRSGVDGVKAVASFEPAHGVGQIVSIEE